MSTCDLLNLAGRRYSTVMSCYWGNRIELLPYTGAYLRVVTPERWETPQGYVKREGKALHSLMTWMSKQDGFCVLEHEATQLRGAVKNPWNRRFHYHLMVKIADDEDDIEPSINLLASKMRRQGFGLDIKWQPMYQSSGLTLHYARGTHRLLGGTDRDLVHALSNAKIMVGTNMSMTATSQKIYETLGVELSEEEKKTVEDAGWSLQLSDVMFADFDTLPLLN